MTSKEFARLLGVSQSTVSRALNDSTLVPAEKKEFIRRRAAELGFELNRQAQSLKTNRTGTVGVLFPRHFRSMNHNPMLAHCYDHIQRDLIANGYDVMMVYDHGAGAGGTVLERMVRRRKLDGLILFRKRLSESEAEVIKTNDFPCVAMLNPGKVAGVGAVMPDDEHDGFVAGSFLGQFSAYEPMYLSVEEEPDKANRHLRGLRRGLAKHGRILAPIAVHRCRLSFESAYDFAKANRAAFEGKKTALMAHNDLTAMAVTAALMDMGIAVPEQVQVLGVDDVPASAWFRPSLSTLRVMVPEMVAAGCRMLREKIEGKKGSPVVEKFRSELVLRETTMAGEVL